MNCVINPVDNITFNVNISDCKKEGSFIDGNFIPYSKNIEDLKNIEDSYEEIQKRIPESLEDIYNEPENEYEDDSEYEIINKIVDYWCSYFDEGLYDYTSLIELNEFLRKTFELVECDGDVIINNLIDILEEKFNYSDNNELQKIMIKTQFTNYINNCGNSSGLKEGCLDALFREIHEWYEGKEGLNSEEFVSKCIQEEEDKNNIKFNIIKN